MGSIRSCILFGGIVFAAMLVGVLYPKTPEKVIVVLGKNASSESIFSVLQAADGQLIDVLGKRSYLVSGADEEFVRRLYKAGAFLVVDGNARYGCSGQLTDTKTSKPTVYPFREQSV